MSGRINHSKDESIKENVGTVKVDDCGELLEVENIRLIEKNQMLDTLLLYKKETINYMKHLIQLQYDYAELQKENARLIETIGILNEKETIAPQYNPNPDLKIENFLDKNGGQ
jgi:hypothetical protein